ncbi:acetyl-CoA carboxylase, carboxyltransferase subunit beta [Fuchsiella alkaliacetigena]|uniref:acetyl-CoA carboxylase, carboxyltransferase subunit beta n=1 Tax=Fuchsiella alkaliacetigena TaxID=957042 RepID=UPI00200B3157|nr:acetyl-CoA carboxylase, carboxyltransferase subunit beta [Fuchsiella alkaliacetigena]MCK8825771.1 acetyl-CoA carboxylase, carboxyltransferase subunit beta [Fuchsiella alkaliacetigena]
MFKNWFSNKDEYVTVKRQLEKAEQEKQSQANEEKEQKSRSDLWTKCKDCGEIILNKKLDENLKTCSECGYHFRLNAQQRVNILFDDGEFKEYDEGLESSNPLDFPNYEEKLSKYQEQTGLTEAVVTGEGNIAGHTVITAIIDANFLMGSMNSVVGEKVTRAIEEAYNRSLPLIIISGGGGGARMYEGMLSLMQMAKTSSALARFDEAGQLFISVLTDPTYGGVSASFASLGDIILAEQGAKVGFAGPRVIKQTINAELPDDFQTSNFQLEHGMVDQVVDRKEMKEALATILEIHSLRGEE